MSAEPQPIDISGSSELLTLAEEVRRSGIGRVLKRGAQELALVTPIVPPSQAAATTRRRSRQATPDAILNIIGIGASAEPTDVARDEQHYLAEAYTAASR